MDDPDVALSKKDYLLDVFAVFVKLPVVGRVAAHANVLGVAAIGCCERRAPTEQLVGRAVAQLNARVGQSFSCK